MCKFDQCNLFNKTVIGLLLSFTLGLSSSCLSCESNYKSLSHFRQCCHSQQNLLCISPSYGNVPCVVVNRKASLIDCVATTPQLSCRNSTHCKLTSILWSSCTENFDTLAFVRPTIERPFVMANWCLWCTCVLIVLYGAK